MTKKRLYKFVLSNPRTKILCGFSGDMFNEQDFCNEHFVIRKKLKLLGVRDLWLCPRHRACKTIL